MDLPVSSRSAPSKSPPKGWEYQAASFLSARLQVELQALRGAISGDATAREALEAAVPALSASLARILPALRHPDSRELRDLLPSFSSQAISLSRLIEYFLEGRERARTVRILQYLDTLGAIFDGVLRGPESVPQ